LKAFLCLQKSVEFLCIQWDPQLRNWVTTIIDVYRFNGCHNFNVWSSKYFKIPTLYKSVCM
jgi:hypothetical protein